MPLLSWLWRLASLKDAEDVGFRFKRFPESFRRFVFVFLGVAWSRRRVGGGLHARFEKNASWRAAIWIELMVGHFAFEHNG